MIKLLAFMTFATFAAGSAFAGNKACCAKQASNNGKVECVSFATLNLNADQKTKLETWEADCMKAGCTKESHKHFMQQAKGILSKDQFAALKAECSKMGEKTQS